VAKNGRYGPYVTEVLPEDAPKSAKPRTSSLFKTMTLDTITLEDALRLLTLPRVVGADPESGEDITAQNGRYGPYLKKGSDSRSIEEEEKLLTITLEEALAVFAQPKTRGRAAAKPGRELGDDPATGSKITVKSGRFGPYVTDGEYNATLRQGDDESTVTLERAAELLAEKRAKGPAPKKRGAKKTAKKTAAKKTTKKAAAKKTTTKKAAAKKST
jgi:DNA topoisomerase-1